MEYYRDARIKKHGSKYHPLLEQVVRAKHDHKKTEEGPVSISKERPGNVLTLIKRVNKLHVHTRGTSVYHGEEPEVDVFLVSNHCVEGVICQAIVVFQILTTTVDYFVHVRAFTLIL